MKKLVKKILLVTASANLLINPMGNVLAEQPTQPMLSLGASLQGNGEKQTRSLLGADNVSSSNTLYIDGTTINAYLGDGSNAGTVVYSSALIEPQATGFGVQVQIVTPQNITLVTPMTYQNAAITSGAQDILIKIATVSPVTGEGALAGVYALLEKSGVKLNKQSIKVAEKEIKIVEQVKEEDKLSDIQANQIISDIKKEIIVKLSENIEIDAQEAKVIIHNVLDKHQISPNLVSLTELVEFSIEFSKTEAAKKKETVTQLEQSVDKSIWNESKRAELEHFMGAWELAMGQRYTEYTPSYQGDFYGWNVPNDILDKIGINGANVPVEWATEGLKPNVYNLVSVYKEDKLGDGQHLYLFMIYNGEAVVYHTQQSGVDESGLVHFKPTANESLANTFSEIVKGIAVTVLPEPEATEEVESDTTNANELSELWNGTKREKLRAFISEWELAMGQRYIEHTPEAPGDFYGATMPMYAVERFGLDGELYPAEWSLTGDIPGVYNIVACYIEDTRMFPGMYLFAILNGEPMVFYSKQNQGGQPHDGFYSRPTENWELTNGFSQIVKE